MAQKPTNQTDMDAIKAIAHDLFIERSPRAFGRNMKQVAKQCFVDAELFHEASQMYELGEMETKAAVGPQLSDVSAPNLVKVCKDHPHNLVSRRFGDLKKVAKILDWLNDNRDAEVFESDEMNIRYDKETTKLARILFPEYVVRDAAATTK